MRRFRIIGYQCDLRRKSRTSSLSGPVIASREAIFVVVDAKTLELLAGSVAGGIGGVAGGFLGGLFAGLAVEVVATLTGDVSRRTTALQINYGDLPLSIRKHRDWPIKRPRDTIVIVIPRGQVIECNYRWYGSFDLFCEDVEYKLSLLNIARRSVTKFLRQSGWTWSSPSTASVSMWLRMLPLYGIIIGGFVSSVIALALAGEFTPVTSVLIWSAVGSIFGGLFGLGFLELFTSRADQ